MPLAPGICERCRIGQLKPHCESETCAWSQCQECRTTFRSHHGQIYDVQYRPDDEPREAT